MTIFSRWRASAGNILHSETPKGPWGGGNGNGGNNDGGPRNPWAFPPDGKRKGAAGPSALDQLLKKARRGGPGGGSGGGGLPTNLGSASIWFTGAALILIAGLIFSCFHAIGPQQRGVVMFLGRYAGTLEPGIKLTMPWPLVSVEEVDVQQIRTEDFPQGSSENLMLTSDRNIVNLAYSVRWDIRDPQDYVFQLAQPQDTVRATAESAMREVLSSVSLNEALGSGRTAIEGRVQDRMQQILNDYRSGVRVQGVAIKQADPPETVNDAFKDVTAAQQEAEGSLNQARAYAQQVLANAQGEASQFDQLYAQYKLAPEVTRRRLYYETMEDVLAKANKTIIEAPGVTPYLPLPEMRRRTEPQAGAQPATPPTPLPNPPQGGNR